MSARVVPMPSSTIVLASPTLLIDDHLYDRDEGEKSKEWRKLNMDMLDEIIQYGHVKNHYKMGTPRRTWNVISTTMCCSTVCSPCMAWDCMCCTMSLLCRSNPFKWGLAFHGIAQFCNETFEDTRLTKLSMFTSKDITCLSMQTVCNAYLAAFDAQIALKTTQGAKRANIIRERLFHIIQLYAPGFKYAHTRDDGDIDKLRHIVKGLPDEYNRYSRMGLL